MEAGHDGADRDVEDLRGVGVREVAEVDEHEHVTEVVRDFGESCDDIVTALSAVPHDFRDVLVLVDLGDFSYADAAQILDIPVGTVMSRLHRGRRILKRELAESTLEEAT